LKAKGEGSGDSSEAVETGLLPSFLRHLRFVSPLILASVCCLVEDVPLRTVKNGIARRDDLLLAIGTEVWQGHDFLVVTIFDLLVFLAHRLAPTTAALLRGRWILVDLYRRRLCGFGVCREQPSTVRIRSNIPRRTHLE